MGKALAAIAIVIVLAVGGWALFGQKDSSNNSLYGNSGQTQTSQPANTNGTTQPDTNKAQAQNTVSIENMLYTPAQITVAKGTKVTWTNNDSTAHTVTADTNNTFASGTLNPGASYSFTFNETGSFAYHCDFHPSMHGTVVVR